MEPLPESLRHVGGTLVPVSVGQGAEPGQISEQKGALEFAAVHWLRGLPA